MGHHKLERFAENLTFPNLFQVSYEMLKEEGFALRGRWSSFFGNDNPISLELGCGKGEYTVNLARINPERNYIRTRIELIEQFFAPNEVSEIWITFPDPQPKKENKRLTCERFLGYYKQFLLPGSPIHLKTDSQELYEYTLNEVIPAGNYRVEYSTNDLYALPSSEHPEIPCLVEAQMTQTFYERMFLSQGMPITYLKFYVK